MPETLAETAIVDIAETDEDDWDELAPVIERMLLREDLSVRRLVVREEHVLGVADVEPVERGIGGAVGDVGVVGADGV